jgi:hypothetical protein
MVQGATAAASLQQSVANSTVLFSCPCLMYTVPIASI